MKICNHNQLINNNSKIVFSPSKYLIREYSNWVRELVNLSKKNNHIALVKISRPLTFNIRVRVRIQLKVWANKSWIDNNIVGELKGLQATGLISQIKKLTLQILGTVIKISLDITIRLSPKDFLSRKGRFKISFQKVIFKLKLSLRIIKCQIIKTKEILDQHFNIVTTTLLSQKLTTSCFLILKA
jgi:hypothetical protein